VIVVAGLSVPKIIFGMRSFGVKTFTGLAVIIALADGVDGFQTLSEPVPDCFVSGSGSFLLQETLAHSPDFHRVSSSFSLSSVGFVYKHNQQEFDSLMRGLSCCVYKSIKLDYFFNIDNYMKKNIYVLVNRVN